MGVIPNGASGPSYYAQRFATGASGSDRLALPDRDENSVKAVLTGDVEALADGAFGPFGAVMKDFMGWVDAVVQALGGKPDALLGLISDVTNGVIDLPAWLSGVQDWVFGIAADFEALLEALSGDYEGNDSILLGIQQIARTFRSVLTGGPLINLGQLTTAPVNLLPSGAFDTEGTVLEGEGWSWDDTVGRTSAGSARFDATGDAGLLFSPGPAEVEPGKQYTARCWVRWDGVTATGVAFSPFVRWSDAGGGMLSESALPTITDPSSASGTWVELSGGVTAPANARWAHLVFQVESGVIGTVWWDDAGILAAQQSLPQSIIDGLTGALQDLGDWIESLVDQLLGALGVPSLGTLFDKITDLADEVGDWLDDTQDRAAELADLIGDLLADPASVIGTLPQTLISNASGWLSTSLAGKATTAALSQVESFVNDLIAAILQAIRGIPVVGGTLADVISDLGGLKSTADTAQESADKLEAGIVEGWAGGSSAGAEIAVYDTMAAIRAAVDGGSFTRYNILSSQTWSIPSQFSTVTIICQSAGGNGGAGTGGNQGTHGDDGGVGGEGGLGGGFNVLTIDAAAVSALHITIGASNGAATVCRANNSGGDVLLQANVGAEGGVATMFGWSPSASSGGRGGRGGQGRSGSVSNESYYGRPGEAGIPSNGATGGVGGTSSNYNGAGGGSGGAVAMNNPVPCGGGGGGGGQGGGRSGNAVNATGYNGGAGGPGGFPGGGGGGGGGRGMGMNIGGSNGSQGSGGPGAAGVVILLCQ